MEEEKELSPACKQLEILLNDQGIIGEKDGYNLNTFLYMAYNLLIIPSYQIYEEKEKIILDEYIKSLIVWIDRDIKLLNKVQLPIIMNAFSEINPYLPDVVCLLWCSCNQNIQLLKDSCDQEVFEYCAKDLFRQPNIVKIPIHMLCIIWAHITIFDIKFTNKHAQEYITIENDEGDLTITADFFHLYKTKLADVTRRTPILGTTNMMNFIENIFTIPQLIQAFSTCKTSSNYLYQREAYLISKFTEIKITNN